MAQHNATLAIAPARMAEALRLTLSLTTQREGQVAAQREMLASLQSVLDARRQRIILSRSSINWVKWTVLLVQAGLTLLAVAVIHSDNPTANRTILAIFATGVGVAVLLIPSHSQLFTGDISVPPTVLLQIMPEADLPRFPAPGSKQETGCAGGACAQTDANGTPPRRVRSSEDALSPSHSPPPLHDYYASEGRGR